MTRNATAYAACLLLFLAPTSASFAERSETDGATTDGATDQAETSIEVTDALDVQVLISRQGFSPGVLDGHWGQNTRGALEAWQSANDLEATGRLDDATRDKLEALGVETVVEYTITEEDAAGPFVDEIPDDMMEQSKLDRLGYTSLEEMLAERHWTTPETLRTLNEGTSLEAGTTIRVPNVGERDAVEGSIEVEVDKSADRLIVRSGERTVFYAPVTSGSENDPLPIGDWKVLGVSTDPTYSYDPELIMNSPEDHEKAILPAGPNNPVGLVWIDIDKEHYGLHGTSEPAKIGYAESNGCVRLTNWDAMHLAHMVQPGTPVHFVE